MRAYWCDEDSIYVMRTAKLAAQLYQRETGKLCKKPYPVRLTRSELHNPILDLTADHSSMSTHLTVAKIIERGDFGFVGGYE